MSITSPVQVVIPMAGLGSRFTEAGYETPKPLLPIHGIPMYWLVIANLLHESVASVTVIAQKQWGLAEDVSALNKRLRQTLNLIEIDYTTGGPAETVELARVALDPDLPVVTGNSDQYVDAELGSFYARLTDPGISGLILTMGDNHPKWSYVALDESGFVSQVQEKQVISPYATVGIYGFKSANLLFHAFDRMRNAQDTCNGEYYVAPSYNQLVDEGAKIAVSHLGSIDTVMYGLGTPVDYESFLSSPASLRAVAKARMQLSL